MTGSSSRRGRMLLLGAVFSVIMFGLLLALFLSRDHLLHAYFESKLAQRGFACEDLDLVSSLVDGTIVLAPATCTAKEGPVSAVEWTSDMTLTLNGLTPEAIATEQVEVRLRKRTNHVPGGWEGALAKALKGRRVVTHLVLDGAELSKRTWPKVDVDEANIRRGKRDEALLTGLSVRQPEALVVSVDRVVIPIEGDTDTFKVRDLEATFTADKASLSGTTAIEASVLGVTVASTVSATLTARKLSTGDPIWSFRL